MVVNIVVDFESRIKKLSGGVDKNKGKEILKIVSKILDFCLNERNEQGVGLKILTPDRMHSRLPVTSAQLKPENNSEKLKNEIEQLLYSLYRSKKLTKQLYKSLVDII